MGVFWIPALMVAAGHVIPRRHRSFASDQVTRVNSTETPTPSWGLDRIDQRNFPLNNACTYNATGAGVTAYVIDTGILTTHTHSVAGQPAGSPPLTTATTPLAATAMARTWPERSAVPPLASRRPYTLSPYGCSTEVEVAALRK
jgi:hypothetical protein